MGAVYVVAVANVADQALLQQYESGAVPTLGGAEILAVDATATTLEGDPRGRVVILKFPDEDAALGWYNSAEYQQVQSLRVRATTDGWMGVAKGLGQ